MRLVGITARRLNKTGLTPCSAVLAWTIACHQFPKWGKGLLTCSLPHVHSASSLWQGLTASHTVVLSALPFSTNSLLEKEVTGFRNWIEIRTGVAGAEGKGSQGGLPLPSSLAICVSPALLSGGLRHLAATQATVILGFSDPGQRDPFCPITANLWASLLGPAQVTWLTSRLGHCR